MDEPQKPKNIGDAEDSLNTFLDFLERRFYVSVHSRGGAYGASKMVLRDQQSGEEYEFDRESKPVYG